MWHASRIDGYRPAKRVAALLLASGMVPGGLAAAEGVGHPVTVHDRPVVSARNVVGEAGAPIRLDIEVVPPSNRQVASTYLLGLPLGAHVTDTTNIAAAAEEESVIEVTRWNLPELAITLQPGQVGTFAMRVAAMSDSVEGGTQQVVSSGFTVSAQPPHPTPLRPALHAEMPRTVVAVIPRGTGTQPPASAPDAAAPPKEKPVEAKRPETKSPEVKSPEVKRPDPAPQPPPAPPAPALRPSLSAATPVATPEPGAQALVGRAEQLIRRGDISGARLTLERALSRNEPRAAFLLAQTYDPNVLRTWKVRGLQPDAERAQALYARAGRDTLAEPTNLAASPR
ncbi:hypothetical protein [Methylobacterium tarhaniae]|uniref:hypothetical protein n=1 Tax=Methylobacterium tarhaniae TaxID=1187852 RepID=UPI00069FBA2E|nr:hypothetical protein [Methylobacterium tarhaniae]